jgi:hypothetical protein
MHALLTIQLIHDVTSLKDLTTPHPAILAIGSYSAIASTSRAMPWTTRSLPTVFYRAAALEDLRLKLIDTKPAVAACPWCEIDPPKRGEKCLACYGGGWIPPMSWRGGGGRQEAVGAARQAGAGQWRASGRGEVSHPLCLSVHSGATWRSRAEVPTNG